MVNIYTNPVTPMPDRNKKASPVRASSSPKKVKDTEAQAQAPTIERRKNPDRRQSRSNRGPYDLRSGGDRRKNGPGRPSIETEV